MLRPFSFRITQRVIAIIRRTCRFHRENSLTNNTAEIVEYVRLTEEFLTIFYHLKKNVPKIRRCTIIGLFSIVQYLGSYLDNIGAYAVCYFR